MASTYSPNLRLELIGTGEQQGSWGSTTNTNLGTLLEQAIGGYESVTVSDAGDTTLSTANGATDQSRNMTLNLTGTISAARNVICPAIEKLYIVKNATTGGYAVTFKVSGQTGVSIPNGSVVFLYVDGTDARSVTGSIASQAASAVAITGGTINVGDAQSPRSDLQMTATTTPTAVVVGSISGTTLTVTSVASGTLAVGNRLTIAATGLDYNTYITALGTGTGGTGTYTISQTATVGSTTINAYPSSYNTLTFYEKDTDVAANQPMGGIEWYGSDASTPGGGVKAYIAAVSESATPDSAMVFGTSDNSASTLAVERMRIGSTGEVLVTSGSLSIGNADTTITRSAAGVLAVEGGNVPLENRANTFTAAQTLSTGASNPSLRLQANAGVSKPLQFATGATVRWQLASDAAAESGSNVGSDLRLNRYDDAGVSLGATLIINRASGLTTLESLSVPTIDLGNTDTTISRVSSGVAAIEGKNIALNGTSEVLTTGTIELGAASDTTISRSAAGVIAVEGGVIPKENRANTFTANQIINANVGIGASASTSTSLYITKTKTGGTVTFGVYDGGVVQSDVTAQAHYYNTEAGTAAASFTLGTLGHYRASQQAFGAGSSVTSQYGFLSGGNLIGATNNYAFNASDTSAVTSGKTAYGFYSSVNTATGGGTTYGFYAGGTAPNRFSGDVTVFGAGGLGYGTGSGGTVTQATNRTTGVTLNKTNGAITLVSAAGTATWQSFTVTNSTVAATDTVIVSQKSGTDLNEIHVTAVAAGSFRISFATTGGTTTEQPVFNFSIIKAVTS